MKHITRFVTIFTDTRNFHLVKDVGQLPYFMYKSGQYQAKLISYKNEASYPYLSEEVKGLELDFIKDRGRFLYFERGILNYLFSASKSIDVLNLFHFKKEYLLYLFIYKLLQPKGKVYLKLDINLSFFREYNAFFYSNYAIKNYFLRWVTKSIFRLTDVLSVETEEARAYVQKVYPSIKNKLICLPNGVDSLYIEKELKVKAFEEKENIIITVGRIGTEQKNTELLLEALEWVDLQDWKVYIIGPAEPSFEPFIRKFFEINPHLADKIIFTGNISDRKILFDWYNRAKIFCLTSRWEGFPIAFPEALYFGNYLITTPVSSAADVTGQGQFGKIVPAEAAGLAAAINECIKEGFLDARRFKEITRFSRAHFCWPEIVKTLTEKL